MKEYYFKNEGSRIPQIKSVSDPSEADKLRNSSFWEEIPQSEFLSLEHDLGVVNRAQVRDLTRRSKRKKFGKLLLSFVLIAAISCVIVLFACGKSIVAKLSASEAVASKTIHPAADLSELNSQLAKLRAQIEALNNRVGEIEQQLTDANRDRQILAEKITATQQQLAATELANTNLAQRLAAAERESATLREFLADHDKWSREELYRPLVKSGAIRTE